MCFRGQVLQGKPYNRKCDVYSFGVCLWETYCCDLPYPFLSFSEVSSAVVRHVSNMFIFMHIYLCSNLIYVFSIYFIFVSFSCNLLEYDHVTMLEFKAGNTKMLPEFFSKHNEKMLGCKSR